MKAGTVELEFKVGGQFHIIAISFLVDFCNGNGREIGVDVGGNGCRYQGYGHACHLRLNLVPHVISVETDLAAIGQCHVVFIGEPFPILVGKGDCLIGEVLLHKRLNLLRELRN